MKGTVFGVVVVGVLCAGLCSAEIVRGVDIDFVPIGTPGYQDDSTGVGFVDYEYRIGQHEVSIAQFAAAYAQDPNISDNNNENHWQATLGTDAPAVNVTWHEAARFCNFLTSGSYDQGAYSLDGSGNVIGVNRVNAVGSYPTVYVLPTEDEWYKAAYFTGSGYSLYANGLSIAPTNEVDALYDNRPYEGPAWTVSDGSVEQNGTFNMMGNVWEHSESLSGMDVIYHGGGYTNSMSGVLAIQSTTTAYESFSSENLNVGFRVAAIPEPGTISLMSLSALGLFTARTIRRRKRKLFGRSLAPVRRRVDFCDSFSSAEEWAAAQHQPSVFAHFYRELFHHLRVSIVRIYDAVRSRLRSIDRAFWNRVVAWAERPASRKGLLMKKAANKLDAFLAMIMK